MRINEILNEGLSPKMKERAKENFKKKDPTLSDQEIKKYLDKWDRYYKSFPAEYQNIFNMSFEDVKLMTDEKESYYSRGKSSAYLVTTISEARKILSTGRLFITDTNSSSDPKLSQYKYQIKMFSNKLDVAKYLGNKDVAVVLSLDITTNYFRRKSLGSKDYEYHEYERPIYDSATGYFYSNVSQVPIDRLVTGVSFLFDRNSENLNTTGITDLKKASENRGLDLEFYSIRGNAFVSRANRLRDTTTFNFLKNLDQSKDTGKRYISFNEYYPRDCRDLLFFLIGKKSTLSSGAKMLADECVEQNSLSPYITASTWTGNVSEKDKSAKLDILNFIRKRRFSQDDYLSFLADELNSKFNTNIKVEPVAITEARLKSPTKKNLGNFRKIFDRKIPMSKSKEIVGEFIIDDDLFAILDNEMVSNPDKDARPIIAEWVKMNIPGIARISDDEDFPSGLFSTISSHPEARK